MRKNNFRQIFCAIAGITACSALLATGCTLRPDGDEYETKEAVEVDEDESSSENEAEATEEEASTDELTVVVDETGSHVQGEEESTVREYETVAIEDLELPTDENGEWTDYIIDTATLDIYRDNEDEGYVNVKIHIDNQPIVYVSDTAVETELNAKIYELVQNNYMYRFQMKDLDIELTCTQISATRFLCYQFAGAVYHTGDDARYESEREYLYYLTFDRMTATVINLETAYGVQNAYNDIANGDYEIIRAESSVFERFDNELLADVYVNEPVFEDDLDHKLDFYIQEGYVHVVIWVGEENGSYAIFRLGESLI